MSDRLAEIEATRKKILSEYEFSRADDDMLMLLTSGIPWLLARAHELDTQAELMVDVYKGADLPELVARVNAAEARVRELEARAAADKGVMAVVLDWAQAKTELEERLENGPLEMDIVGDLMMAHRLSREKMWAVIGPLLEERVAALAEREEE